SLVDIELRRRHDLIPNLVGAVTGMRDHEFHLQPRLATLRARQNWTVNPAPLAVAEAYPGLKSHQGFLHLHQSLTETEDRIALARRYLNEITMHYNTRLQTIPEGCAARLFGMRSL
ncbi:MAG: LemA family protein, partial [Terrimicrobiaceae bacterium]